MVLRFDRPITFQLFRLCCWVFKKVESVGEESWITIYTIHICRYQKRLFLLVDYLKAQHTVSVSFMTESEFFYSGCGVSFALCKTLLRFKYISRLFPIYYKNMFYLPEALETSTNGKHLWIRSC